MVTKYIACFLLQEHLLANSATNRKCFICLTDSEVSSLLDCIGGIVKNFFLVISHCIMIFGII